jgi:ribose transport system permease protein
MSLLQDHLRRSSTTSLARTGVLIALAALILFGAMRYDNFASAYNVLSFLRYNSMIAAISLGMVLVIMTGGIDLSVGAVAALASVVAALLSPYHWAFALMGGLMAGAVVGLINGLVVTRLAIQPFIATLATMLAAYGAALLLADNQSVSVSYDGGFTEIGQGDFLGLPMPVWLLTGLYLAVWFLVEWRPYGRHLLAIGDGDSAAAMMGLEVNRVLIGVYVMSGTCAALAGVILASQFGAGQPTEGVGWELFAIAAVVVGGTMLSGGSGSIGGTLAGVLLLGMLFNILNLENGLGRFSLSAYSQSIIRGGFLLVVVVLQSRFQGRNGSSSSSWAGA